jgi:nitrogen regulatory protein PII
MEELDIRFELIITIVNRGKAEQVMDAARKEGAEGGTVILGRGTSIHETVKLLGIPIEPAKEIVLTLIDSRKTERVLAAITEAVGLDKPGKGIAFVLDVEKAVGIVHLMKKK